MAFIDERKHVDNLVGIGIVGVQRVMYFPDGNPNSREVSIRAPYLTRGFTITGMMSDRKETGGQKRVDCRVTREEVPASVRAILICSELLEYAVYFPFFKKRGKKKIQFV